MSFLHFFADISNKSKAVIAVYGYAFESSRFALLENSKCQNSFSWGPSFGPFWSVKYLNFGGEN